MNVKHKIRVKATEIKFMADLEVPCGEYQQYSFVMCDAL
jgi:hypothetical protein